MPMTVAEDPKNILGYEEYVRQMERKNVPIVSYGTWLLQEGKHDTRK